MSDNWTIVLKGDWWLPHLVNMLNEYKGNGEQTSCRDEIVEQIKSQIDRSDGNLNPTTRPLVVIDPEDREQVRRLLKLLVANKWVPGASHGLRDALREFADPKVPKPDEPLGLGAVVRDRDGDVWVRRDEVHFVCPKNLNEALTWGEVEAVEVLAEGWSA